MPESNPFIRHVVGVMTGTSIDGIDAAIVRIEGRGMDMRATLVRHLSETLGALQSRLRAAATQQPMSAGEFARLAWDFGTLHADMIERLVPDEVRPDLICVHGQTVFHQPPISWQLVNAAPIAARFRCPVVSDLRQADLAHGGQGAPITPIADWILFRDELGGKRRAIVNLGGFCNVTILPRAKTCASVPSPAAGGNPRNHEESLSAIRGFDVCACNQLLDAIARETLGQPFDVDGAAAARGRANPQAVEALRAILDRQRIGGRSLGTGDEALQWVRSHRHALSADDLAASAVDAIARTIHAAVDEHGPDELILAGGGARNQALIATLERDSDTSSTTSSTTVDFGVPLEAREAMCFAVLGALCQDGVPITLPAVTGCQAGRRRQISGLWSNRA